MSQQRICFRHDDLLRRAAKMPRSYIEHVLRVSERVNGGVCMPVDEYAAIHEMFRKYEKAHPHAPSVNTGKRLVSVGGSVKEAVPCGTCMKKKNR